MKKLILQMQMSVDGCVGASDGRPWQLWGWGDHCPWDDALKREFNAIMSRVDTILLSRKMAEEGYIAHWTHAARNHPRDAFFAFARRIVEARKVVLSDKLDASTWDRTTLASGDLPREVSSLKAERGERDMIVFGGAGFASALIAAGLIDELQLFINPTALGKGARIFDQSGFRRFRLLGAKAYACGIVVSRYASAG